MRRPLIVAVEDEAGIRALLADILSQEGFDLRVAGSMAEFLALDASGADLYLIDLGLPDGNGLAIVRRLREETAAGIIVLTGRAGESEQVLGLELGADDYMIKPFRPRELIARINAVLRRLTRGTGQGSPVDDLHKVDHEFGGFQVILNARRVFSVGGEEVDLTTAEFELLAALLARRGHALSRDQIVQLMKGRVWETHDRTVDGLVSRLRRKLPSPRGHPPFIRTIHGTGYAFVG